MKSQSASGVACGYAGTGPVSPLASNFAEASMDEMADRWRMEHPASPVAMPGQVPHVGKILI